MIVIVNVFPKLQTVKILVRPLSKKRRFRIRFDSQRVKASLPTTCEISIRALLSPPVSREILGVMFYTLTAYGKYPLQSSENLQLPIQMQLSEKTKNIFSIFCSICRICIKF